MCIFTEFLSTLIYWRITFCEHHSRRKYWFFNANSSSYARRWWRWSRTCMLTDELPKPRSQKLRGACYIAAPKLFCYIDRWDIPSSELQRCPWLSERWQDIIFTWFIHPWPAGCVLSCKNYRSCQPPPKNVVELKNISFYLPWLLDQELNRAQGARSWCSTTELPTHPLHGSYINICAPFSILLINHFLDPIFTLIVIGQGTLLMWPTTRNWLVFVHLLFLHLSTRHFTQASFALLLPLPKSWNVRICFLQWCKATWG